MNALQKYRWLLAFLGVCAVLFVDAGEACAQRRVPFQVPSGDRGSVRGHIYIRNGLVRDVYRERWGNGLQANGAYVLTSLFDNAAWLGSHYLNPSGAPNQLPQQRPAPAGFDSESGEREAKAAAEQRTKTLNDIESTANGFLKKLDLDPVKKVSAKKPAAADAKGGGFDSQ